MFYCAIESVLWLFYTHLVAAIFCVFAQSASVKVDKTEIVVKLLESVGPGVDGLLQLLLKESKPPRRRTRRRRRRKRQDDARNLMTDKVEGENEMEEEEATGGGGRRRKRPDYDQSAETGGWHP
jgi:hypothetical protein